MTDLHSQLSASVLHAELPLDALLARLRLGNESIEQLSALLDESRAQVERLERLATRQSELIDMQRQQMNKLLAVDSTLPALLRPQI